jgi:hypothetical protein
MLSSCGGSGGGGSNAALGKLPGMAKSYKEKIESMEADLKASTDLKKAQKLDQEIKGLEEESDKTLEEYLANNTIEIPFIVESDDRYEIKEIAVESVSDSRIGFIAKVLLKQDIRNNFGNPPGYANTFFTYMKAVDAEGTSLTRRMGVMAPYSRGPFKTNDEIEVHGSLDGPADMVDFVKLVFISKEDYSK